MERLGLMRKELLFSVTAKDFIIQTFRGSGKGGQHRNVTDSAVRLIHRESGAVGEAQDERSQWQNKRLAFKRCIETNTFKVWHAQKVKALSGQKTIAQLVEEEMAPEKLRSEQLVNGKWEPYKDERQFRGNRGQGANDERNL